MGISKERQRGKREERNEHINKAGADRGWSPSVKEALEVLQYSWLALLTLMHFFISHSSLWAEKHGKYRQNI